jgi:hypothetical protein
MDVQTAAEHGEQPETSGHDQATATEGNENMRTEENKFQKAIAAWRSMPL